MRGWARDALEALDAAAPTALITQVSAEGSTPREVGAKMIVTPTRTMGTIGGGHLELQATLQARRLLEDQAGTALLQDYPLGPVLAQCCGGHVRLLIERLTLADRSWIEALLPSPNAPSILTRINREGGGPRRELVPENSVAMAGPVAFLDATGEPLDAARPPLRDCHGILERVDRHALPLYLFGAGHVGQAVAQVMSLTSFHVSLFDERVGDDLSLDLPAETLPLDDPDTAVAEAAPGGYFLVFTHSHDLDYALVRGILRRGDAAFCGLIGSKTKRVRFGRRFDQDGLTEEQAARLTCPIGAGPLRGKDPASIAVSVATQLLAQQEALGDG